MRFRGFVVFAPIFIYSTFPLPNPALAQWNTGCNLRTVAGMPIIETPVDPGITRIGSVGYQNNLYTYAIAKTAKGDVPVIFRQQHTPCWLIFADPSGGKASLSEGVPIPVANYFARMLLNIKISKNGLQSVQTEINSKRNMYAEDAYAAQYVGLRVPQSINIIPYSTKPKTEIQTDLRKDRS